MYVLCTLLLLSVSSLLKRQKAVKLHEDKAAEYSEKPSRKSPCTRRRKVGNPVRGKAHDRRRSCTTSQLEVLKSSKKVQVRDWPKYALRE